jgi:hypothetical protein
MNILLRTSSTAIWAVLVLATAVSWWLGAHHGVSSGSSTAAAVAVVIIAFIKVALVGDHFMGLRDAPVALRLIFHVWVVTVCTTLVVFYIVGGPG